MEIHAPHGPVNSLRELLTHILIVTIGILIALGLEGIRETWHDHTLVSEAREGFHTELLENRDKLVKEIQNVQDTRSALDAVLSDLPSLKQHSEEIPARLNSVAPALYSLRNTSWDAALSTGALARMKPREVALYGGASQASRMYTEQENRVLQIFAGLAAWRSPGKRDEVSLSALEGQLRVVALYEEVSEHVAKETLADFDRALKAAD
jgi:hypothetical protein